MKTILSLSSTSLFSEANLMVRYIFCFSLLFLFKVSDNWCFAQPWQQLGPGAGGQERALYLHENVAGNYVLYVGSDVSGVWRSKAINPNDVDNHEQYNYDYISNHRIFRFVNKFYRSETYQSKYLFTLSRGGIDRINLSDINEPMKKIELTYLSHNFDNSWVSDMYIGPEFSGKHVIYFTTGNTRVSDVSSNSKDGSIADFYFAELNTSEDQITIINHIDLNLPTTDHDVFCIFVDEGLDSDDPIDDVFFVGTDDGLFYIDNQAQSIKINGPGIAPSSYKVTSIQRHNANTLLITIHGFGVFSYAISTQSWNLHINELLASPPPGLSYSDIYSVGMTYSLDFTQLFPVKNNDLITGYIVTNEFPLAPAPHQNYYIGLFYCDADLNGLPNGNWKAVDIYSTSNDWGWNATKPCSNINGSLLTLDNQLFTGKNGNIFITEYPINSAANRWQQIYTRETPMNCTGGSFMQKGYVNTVTRCIFPEQIDKIWETYYDRLMWYEDGADDSFVQVKNNSQPSTCFGIDLTQSINCTATSSLSDVFFVKEIDGDLYSGIGEGFSSNQGNGYIFKSNGANLWELHRPNGLCGDPIDFYRIGGIDYVYLNPSSPSLKSIYYFDVNTSDWQLLDDMYYPWGNKIVRDFIAFTVGTIDHFLVLANSGTGSQTLYHYTGNLSTGNIIPLHQTSNTNANILLERLELLPYNNNTEFKILVGASQTTNNTQDDCMFEVTLLNFNLNPVPGSSPIFQLLNHDLIDNADEGVSAIEVNSERGYIYAATVTNDPNALIPVRSRLYRTSYDDVTGVISPSWVDISGEMPNKTITQLTSRLSTNNCGEKYVYASFRGLGAWRLEEESVQFIVSTTQVCNGANNGTAEASDPFGGGSSFLWSNGHTTATASNLAPGLYTVTVTNGVCVTSNSVLITEDPSCCNSFLNYVTQSDFNGPSTINTQVNLNENVICDDVVYIDGATISIKEGITITVPSGSQLHIFNSELFSCGNMWAGIVIEDGGELFVHSSNIRDAQYGTRVKQNGHLILRGSTYDHNYVGVHVSDLSTGTVIIDGTTFSCDDCLGNNPLKGGYPGQWPEPKVVTYAGIEAINSVFNIGVSSSASNHFTDLYRGLSLEHCFNTVINSSFRNIISDPYYANPGGYGIYSEMSGGGILRQAGFGEFITSPLSFENCLVAIYTNEGIVTVTSNHMSNVGKGVFINHIKGTNVNVGSNLIHASEQGVLLVGNEKAANVNINYNNIIMNGNFATGVSIFESNQPDPARRFNVNCNSISLDEGVFGIHLDIASSIHILHNNIVLHSFSTYQTGVALDGSSKCYLLENTVTGNSTALHTAFRGQLAGNNNFTLNHSNLTKYGYDFGSNCASDELFSGNTIGEHETGLHINGSGILGVQTHRGNIWLGPFNSWGAQNENMNFDDVDLNPFTVHEPNPGTFYHPTNNVPVGAQWFFAQSGTPWSGSYPNPCSSNLVGGGDNNEKALTYTDTLVVNDSIVAVQFEDELKYFTSRSLLEKLSENDSLRNDNGLFENYYDSKIGSTQSELTDITIKLQSELQTESIQIKTLIITSGLDSLMILDSLILFDNLNKSYRENFLLPLLLKIDSLDVEFDLMQVKQDSIFNIANTLNMTVNPSNDIELYEKQVNEFHFIYRDSLIYQVNPSSLSNLTYIASLCPYAYGKAVFRARAELSRYGFVSFYDDKYNCAQLGYSRQMQTQSNVSKDNYTANKIYPNPATNFLYLFSSKAISNIEFIIFDVSGRAVFTSNIPLKNGIAELNISSLIPGVYSLKTKDNINLGSRSKFIVIR